MMKSTRIFAAPAAILLAAALSAQAAYSTPVYTIEQALQTALGNNPQVKEARERVNEADANVSQAWSAFFPTVSAVVAGFYRKDALTAPVVLFGGEPYNNYNVTLSGVQPLFTSGLATSGLAAAHRRQDIANTQLEVAERDLTSQVIQAFYGTLLQQRRIETLERQRKTQEDLLVTTQRRYQQGTSRRLEVLQTKADLAQIEPQLEKARNDLKIHAAELAQLLGGLNTNAIAVEGTLDPIDWKKVSDEARSSQVLETPEMKLATAQVELQDSLKTVNMSKHYPQLLARGDWSRNTYQKVDLLDPSTTGWTLSLQLQVPLFSGLSSFQERKALNSAIEQAEIDRARVRDEVAIEQIRTAKDLESAQAVYDAASRALEISRDAWDEATRSYRLGTIAYNQLFDSQRTLTNAEFTYDQAKFDAIGAAARYFVAMGWDLSKLVAQLNAPRPRSDKPEPTSASKGKKAKRRSH